MTKQNEKDFRTIHVTLGPDLRDAVFKKAAQECTISEVVRDALRFYFTYAPIIENRVIEALKKLEVKHNDEKDGCVQVQKLQTAHQLYADKIIGS